MPSIHKIKKSPYWFASFTNADGRRSFKSTKKTDKHEANRLCIEWADAAKDGREGRLSEGHVRKIMADIFVRANKTALPSGTVRECLQSFLSAKAIEVEDSSMVQYQIAVKQFLEYLGAKADKPIDTVALKDITGFRDSLARRLSPASTNKSLKILGVAWRAARRDGVITENIFERVKGIKIREGSRRPFTPDELWAVVCKADTEWRGMILMAYYTGARLGDISRMTWGNVNFDTKEICFTAQKTNKPMRLPLHPAIMRYLMAIPASDDRNEPLFLKSYGATSTGTLSNRFNNILVDAGLAPKRSHGKAKDGRNAKREANELSFHCIRHNAASDLRNSGANNNVAMAILGHESAAVARGYTKIDQKALRQAVNAMPDITQEATK